VNADDGRNHGDEDSGAVMDFLTEHTAAPMHGRNKVV
jgi:hypothetical protein